MNHRQNAEKIFLAGVQSVLPGKIVTGNFSLNGSVLAIGGQKFSLEEIKNVYVIGAGKASAAMAHYVETILGNRITGGHIVVKYGHSCKLKRIKVTEAGHPIPDANGFRAAAEILKVAADANENDLVICLISGGGSALLADLPEGLLPEELYIVNSLLVRCGATINEINCVRKHLSRIKGGQLARIAWPATLVSLILSDVIGNPLDVIASGPSVPDTSTFGDALTIIEKYQLTTDLTHGILNYLKDGAAGIHPETPKPGDPLFSRTHNILAGTNLTALNSAKIMAEELGYNSFIVNDGIEGDVTDVAQTIVGQAINIRDNPDIRKPVCLLFGGEPTLRVDGNGTGGRNQHIALSAAIMLKGIREITFVSAGTDGTDGPTDAAGAVVDDGTYETALTARLDPMKYLAEFDSYYFFKSAGGHIKTGPTFTNVMDIVVVLAG